MLHPTTTTTIGGETVMSSGLMGARRLGAAGCLVGALALSVGAGGGDDIGGFNSGAAAISIPILNEAGVPQISPSNTAVGLTVKEPGATPGEPDKYYPSGQRTYTRIVARDSIKGPAMTKLMQEDGCTKL